MTARPRTHWWARAGGKPSPAPSTRVAEPMASEDRLLCLHLRSTVTKGVVATHRRATTTGQLTFEWIFDLREDDVHWCTADVAGSPATANRL